MNNTLGQHSHLCWLNWSELHSLFIEQYLISCTEVAKTEWGQKQLIWALQLGIIKTTWCDMIIWELIAINTEKVPLRNKTQALKMILWNCSDVFHENLLHVSLFSVFLFLFFKVFSLVLNEYFHHWKTHQNAIILFKFLWVFVVELVSVNTCFIANTTFPNTSVSMTTYPLSVKVLFLMPNFYFNVNI